MPQHLAPPLLAGEATKATAKLLLQGCQALDRRWEEPSHLGSPSRTPLSPPSTPPKEQVSSVLPSEQRPLLEWLRHLPDPVVEEVISHLLRLVETQLMEDKDKKLIMTMINIEHMKVNDFFFGIHCLLSLVRGFQLSSLQFSRRLWFCLWEYGEITGSRKLSDALCSSLPGLSCITVLSLAHVATDRVVYVVSRHLTALTEVDLASSRVSDRGLRFLTGSTQVTAFHRCGTPSSLSSSAVRSLGPLLDSPARWGELAPPGDLPEARPPPSGCTSLERVNLQSCDGVSEAGVRHLLEALPKLRRLVYHQVSSVLEILIKWGSNLPEEERRDRTLGLTEVEHGFPYGLSPLSGHLELLAGLCPLLTTVTLVTEDRVLEMLGLFPNLTRLTVELEDCLGLGFLALLERRGEQLTELSLSCSSDPEASLPLEVAGGQQGQLFNLAVLSVGLLVPGVTRLSVSGCGLVAASALEKMDLQDRIGSSAWLGRQQWFGRLESLLLMSYEDSAPSMTINAGLFRSVLVSARRLAVLNLEGNFGTFLTDSFFLDLLARNPLPELTTLDISFNDQGGVAGRVPLTDRTARRLLTCARLRELRVSDWTISDPEFAALEDLVKTNNWELFLTRKLVGGTWS